MRLKTDGSESTGSVFASRLGSRSSRRYAVGITCALAAWGIFQLILPQRTPFGVVVLGVILGSSNALLAIGLVLVYRTNRIVNFAHGELGGVAAVLTVLLVLKGVNYFLALGAGLAAGMLVAALAEMGLMRRLKNAPRLLPTAMTIALTQVLGFAALMLPTWLNTRAVTQNFVTPLSRLKFEIRPVVFDGNSVLIVAFAVFAMTGLALFFRKTGYGMAIRAAAENSDRAALCGISTKSLSTLVWVMAGALSAAAAILQAPVVGLTVGTLVGPGLLLRGLAAAVLGRMESLPITAATAIALTVFEQAVFWAYGQSTVIDALLLVIILTGLLVQRRRFMRTDPLDASSWQVVGETRPMPPELRRLPEVRGARAALVVLAVLLALGGPVFLDVGRQTLVAAVVIWAIMGVSLVVVTGWSGQISLGHFGIAGVGAVVGGTLTSKAGWDFFFALGGAALAGMLVAFLLGLPALRMRGFFLAVTTLAFAVATASYVFRLDWLAPDSLVDRPVLFGRIDLHSKISWYYFNLVVLGLIILSLRGLRSSRIGRAVVAVRDNERAAQAYGISPVSAKLAAFAVSGAIAGLAGALLVHHQYWFQLVQFQPSQSLQVFTIAVIGGVGSIAGAVMGAIYVKGSQYLLRGPWALFGTGLGLIVILLLLPKGLGSLLFSARDVALRKVAKRRGIVISSVLAEQREHEEGIAEPAEPFLGGTSVTEGGPEEIDDRARARVR